MTRMQIASSGNVGIPAPDASYKLNVGGNIQCISLNETSDSRFKTGVENLGGVLARLEAMRGVTYRWNEASASVGAPVGEQEIGLIAQEVEGVYPELVNTSAEGYKSVEYTRLTAVLLEAVKELKAENEALRTRIENLEASR
jgi:hypothetical protein